MFTRKKKEKKNTHTFTPTVYALRTYTRARLHYYNNNIIISLKKYNRKKPQRCCPPADIHSDGPLCLPSPIKKRTTPTILLNFQRHLFGLKHAHRDSTISPTSSILISLRNNTAEMAKVTWLFHRYRSKKNKKWSYTAVDNTG